ncbi:hypothetical protein Tco_0979475 [Tanacetum coccineum]
MNYHNIIYEDKEGLLSKELPKTLLSIHLSLNKTRSMVHDQQVQNDGKQSVLLKLGQNRSTPPTTNGIYKVEIPESAHDPSIDTKLHIQCTVLFSAAYGGTQELMKSGIVAEVSLADNVIVEPAHGGSGAGAIFVAAAQSQMNQSASASFGAKGKDDERESIIANDDDPVDMAEWKDGDQTYTASWKEGEVDQTEDSTAEISDESEISRD